MTKIDKVTKALKTKPLTAAQIQARFNVPNVSALIYDIRRRGENVGHTFVGTRDIKSAYVIR